MTRARCVQTDAVGLAAAVLMTAIVGSGCVSSKPEPVVLPAPAAPTAVTRVATLRVGLPAARRWSLLFQCAEAPTAPRIGSAAYVPDSVDRSGQRWLRVAEAAEDSAGMRAPDTLFVRAFDESTDEEIAFERGELDAAVFWPGELSARMRFDARFRDPEMGLRSRGVIACIAGAGDTLGPPLADMQAFNREAFGGDLLPWSELEPGAADGPPAHYVMDSTVPYSSHLLRVLARVARPGGTRTLKLVYLDQPVAGSDAAMGAWRTRGVTPVFAVRCPVLVTARSRDGVRAIGAHAFAEMAPRAVIEHWDSIHGIYR